MAKQLTKAKASAKPKAKTVAKPGKAAKGATKPKQSKAKYAIGDEVIFNGYTKERDEPLFEPEDRLTVVKTERDQEGAEILSVVKSEDYEDYQEDENSVQGEQVFVSEVKKAPKEAADPYKELATSLTEDEQLEAFIGEHDGDPLKAANAAQEAVAENMFRLGGCLAKLYSDRKYLEYGDYEDEKDGDKTKSGSGWDKFTADNFDMNGRKALSYISIYRNFNRLADKVDLGEISQDRRIGWVKLGAMANHVTEDNVEELIDQARELPVDDFRQLIRTDYAQASGEASSGAARVKRTTIKAVLYEDAGAHVTAVFDEVGKQLQTEDLGTILEFIVIDWAHNSLNEKQIAATTKVRQTKLKEIKKGGVDISERQKAFDELTAQVTGGETEDEGEDDGEE